MNTENEELERQVSELTRKCSDITKREEERRAQDEKKHFAEVENLKKLNDQLRQNLENLLTVPKK